MFDIPLDETIFQVLESHGVEIAISCKQGVCGTRLAIVLKAAPDHRDPYLTEVMQAANDRFPL